jgi:hypothetical protein
VVISAVLTLLCTGCRNRDAGSGEVQVRMAVGSQIELAYLPSILGAQLGFYKQERAGSSKGKDGALAVRVASAFSSGDMD